MASGSDDSNFTTFPKKGKVPDPSALNRLAEMSTPKADPSESVRGPMSSVIGAALLPGAPSFFRRRTFSLALLLAGVVAPLVMLLVAFVRRSRITALVLDTGMLTVIQVICALFVLTRAVAIIEAIGARRRGSSMKSAAWVGALLVIVMMVPATWTVLRVRDLSSAIDEVFVSSGVSDAPLAESPISEPVSGATSNSGKEFTTVLLLGGDAGAGRWSLRTDTMILAIIHNDSGRIAMVSIPRNMVGLKFPPMTPMADAFPNGFDDLANAIYPYVYTKPEVANFYKRGELQPEAIALAGAITYSMGITIDDYVLVDMVGFLEVIDALGGVTVTLDKEIPMPGNVGGAKHSYPPTLGPGTVHMDGTVALGFARSRKADSDYSRMSRQRQLLAALAAQTSGTDVLSNFPQITDIMKTYVRTSMSTDEFAFLIDRVRAGATINESFGLNPPLVNPAKPDFAAINGFLVGIKDALAQNVDFPYA